MKALGSFETSVTIFHSTRRNLTENLSIQQHRCGINKSRPLLLLLLLLVLLLLLFLLLCCRRRRLLSQAISSRYFSRTSGDPHRSGFQFQTAVRPVLRVTFQV
jgi:hypothetical protein